MSKTVTYTVSVEEAIKEYMTTAKVVEGPPSGIGIMSGPTVSPQPALPGDGLTITIVLESGAYHNAKVGLQTIGMETGAEGDLIWTPCQTVYSSVYGGTTFRHYHDQWDEDCVDEIHVVFC